VDIKKRNQTMTDRLVQLLECFELKANVFQTGPLCHSGDFGTEKDVGYIHILQQGSLLVESNKHKPLTLSEPSLILYMDTTQHRLIPIKKATHTLCASFEFGAGLVNPIFSGFPEVICLQLEDLTDLKNALHLLFKEASDNHCGRQAVLNRLIEVVFIQILRDLMDEQRIHIGLLAGLAEPRLEKALNALHKEPAKAWSLEELASTAGMSRARFAAKFRDIVGMTPGYYLSEWRICIAQALINKGKPIQLIADTVGYASASALSRAFKAHRGVTPTEWAKQNKNI
jgi:AraC-like DNA-binding protein